METMFELIQSNAWKLHTFGIAATLSFAFIINRARCEADAQLPNRQAAGWALISISLLVCIGATIDTVLLFGFVGTLASIVLALLLAGILVLLSGREIE